MLALAACAEIETETPDPENQFIETLPEGVLTKADPKQDLTAVKIDPIDGCYVFRHRNAVETTFLPLRTRDGRPICSRPQTPVVPS